MIALSILLHAGIAVFMMLYDFQVIFILVQGFFLSNKEWRKLSSFVTKTVVKNKEIVMSKITSLAINKAD